MKILTAKNAILSSEKAVKTAMLTTELSQLKIVNFADYHKFTIVNIREEKKELNQQNNYIETEFKLKLAVITL